MDLGKAETVVSCLHSDAYLRIAQYTKILWLVYSILETSLIEDCCILLATFLDELGFN